MSNGKSATPRATATTRNHEGSSATTKRSAAKSSATAGGAKTTARPRRNTSAKPATDGITTLSVPERHALVAQAAYFRAQARGFAPGRELEDWVAAEAEVGTRIGPGV
jgi:hypothetical protein